MKSEKTRKRAFFGVAVPGPKRHCQGSQTKMTAGPGPAKYDFFVDFSLRLSHTCFLPKKWKNGLFWPVFSTKKWGWARRVDSVSGPRACFFSSVRRGAWKIISNLDFGYFLAYFLVQNWRKIEKLMILLDFWYFHKILPKTCFFPVWEQNWPISRKCRFFTFSRKMAEIWANSRKCRFLAFGRKSVQIVQNLRKMSFFTFWPNLEKFRKNGIFGAPKLIPKKVPKNVFFLTVFEHLF